MMSLLKYAGMFLVIQYLLLIMYVLLIFMKNNGLPKLLAPISLIIQFWREYNIFCYKNILSQTHNKLWLKKILTKLKNNFNWIQWPKAVSGALCHSICIINKLDNYHESCNSTVIRASNRFVVSMSLTQMTVRLRIVTPTHWPCQTN